MGHYEEIKVKCKLSDIGIEILENLQKEKSWLELAKLMPEYPFIEAASRIASKGRYQSGNQDLLSYLDLNKIKTTKNFEYEHYLKIDFQKLKLLEFVMPYLAEDKIYFYYWDEHFDEYSYHFGGPKKPADEYYLDPIKPVIDWGRKFGDPTGFNV